MPENAVRIRIIYSDIHFFPDNVLKTVVPQYSNSKRNVTGKKRGKTPQFYWSWLATHVSGSKIKTINRELDE